MPKLNKDYLRFDAYSIKKLLEQKLSEDSNYTDQIYPSSDLSIFIDIVSNAYQVMMYYINQAGSESIGSDAQYYENINRIVKFLDYHPGGYSTSILEVSLSGVPASSNNYIIPPYSKVDLDIYDNTGTQVSFSTVDHYVVYDDINSLALDENNILTLYNGTWKLYETSFLTEGIPHETFVCENLYCDSEKGSYIAFPHVHALVRDSDGKWDIFKPMETSMFLREDTNKVIGGNDQLFELRLNEYKQIELKFGDGIYAKKLSAGSEVYVAYLKSNGTYGMIDAKKLNASSMNTKISGFNTKTLLAILNDRDRVNALADALLCDVDGVINATPSLKFSNTYPSSTPSEEETVEQIRENAPKYTRSGGRLITGYDFEAFIKSKYYYSVIDVKAMNNWTYMKSFLQWLYSVGVKVYGDGSYFLNSTIKSNFGFEWADSCDFNNVYLWVKMKGGFNISKKEMLRSVQQSKTLTTEIVFMEPVVVNFIPCVYDNGYSPLNWDLSFENFIEIKLSSNTLESPENIRVKVNNIILDFFDEVNQKIGNRVNLDDLTSIILSVNGIDRVRTVYKNGDKEYTSTGISMAKWSSVINGVDMNIINTAVDLEEFMFAQLAVSDLKDRIRVVSDTANQTNQIEY